MRSLEAMRCDRREGLPGVFAAGAGEGSGVGMPGRPVFRGKSDTPEQRPRNGEFQTDFRPTGTHGAEKNDVTFLLFFGALVAHENGGAAGDFVFEENQGAMSVDRKRLGLLLKRCFVGVCATN